MEGRTVKYEQPRFTVTRLDPASFAGQYCGVIGPTATPGFDAATGLEAKNGR